MMDINDAEDCVESGWNVTCPVGQKQAADALLREIRRLRHVILDRLTQEAQELGMYDADEASETRETEQ